MNTILGVLALFFILPLHTAHEPPAPGPLKRCHYIYVESQEKDRVATWVEDFISNATAHPTVIARNRHIISVITPLFTQAHRKTPDFGYLTALEKITKDLAGGVDPNGTYFKDPLTFLLSVAHVIPKKEDRK
jgi:hypothetical protein